jgi:hypothetical protein
MPIYFTVSANGQRHKSEPAGIPTLGGSAVYSPIFTDLPLMVENTSYMFVTVRNGFRENR